MLIVIPKCISSQIILNDAHYHKYQHHDHLQIPCQSVSLCPWLKYGTKHFCLVSSSNPSGGRYSVVQDRSPCSSSKVNIVLWHSFSLFHSVSGSSLPPAKLSDDQPLLTLWQRDRISITGLDDWCRQKKTLAWNRTC